jgi:hypothetical protein
MISYRTIGNLILAVALAGCIDPATLQPTPPGPIVPPGPHVVLVEADKTLCEAFRKNRRYAEFVGQVSDQFAGNLRIETKAHWPGSTAEIREAWSIIFAITNTPADFELLRTVDEFLDRRTGGGWSKSLHLTESVAKDFELAFLTIWTSAQVEVNQ